MKIYYSLPTTSSRPPPNVDLLWRVQAINAGSPLRLNACQPFDLVLGWDLRLPECRKQVLNTIRRLRPRLLVGYPCTLYSIFNENMNYNDKHDPSRPQLLKTLRDEDKDMRQFVMDLCRFQHQEGRLFFLENPLNSRPWMQDEVWPILELPRVSACTAHLGAFGSETVKNEPVRKPIRLASNLPGLDYYFAHKLSTAPRLRALRPHAPRSTRTP